MDPDGLVPAGVPVVTVPAAGHDVMLDDPARVARVTAAGPAAGSAAG